jgi:hypothetical protein
VKLKGVTNPLSREITVKPVQTVGRASLSRNAVTLYKLAPLTGETIGLKLTTPANVKLGHVQLEQKSLDALNFTSNGTAAGRIDGLTLTQSGENNWTIYLQGGKAPVPIDKKGNAQSDASGNPKYKASYNVKLELWAEGTYKLENGKAVPLEFKDAKGKVTKSKPTMVTVKVTIK